MSTRLQIVMDDVELQEIRRVARRSRMTVSEWVRQALRAALQAEAPASTGRKLTAVREATGHAYPTGEIDEMLAEIERGYTRETQ